MTSSEQSTSTEQYELVLDNAPLRSFWLVAAVASAKRGRMPAALQALRNAVRRQPPETWRNGVQLYSVTQ